MDSPSERVDKTDGRTVENKKRVSHRIAHSFTHTLPTVDYCLDDNKFFCGLKPEILVTLVGISRLDFEETRIIDTERIK